MKELNGSLVLTIVLLQPSTVYASDKAMAPGMIAAGPFDLIPMLNLEEQYDDNIFHNNNNKKASLVTRINGGAELALRRKLDRYALRYSFLSSQYHNSPADNFVDHDLSGLAHFDLNRRNRLDVQSGLKYSHNMRGTYFTQGNLATQINEPDRFHEYNSGFNYRYGRIDARGNLGLRLDWDQIVYDNHRERTIFQDKSELEITPGFYLRLMPKTYLTTEIENTFIDYLNNDELSPSTQNNSTSALLDYNKRRYLVGLTWDQSSKTQGSFRFGYLQQEYTGNALPSINAPTWDGEVQWHPKERDNLSVGLSRDIQPSLGTGQARELQDYHASWQHHWPHRLTSKVTGAFQEITNQDIDQSPTNGKSFKFDVKYNMRTWLDIGFNYSYSDFQANTNDNNSTQNLFMFYLHALPKSGNH